MIELSERLKKEIKKAGSFAEKAKESAMEIARAAALSPSQSGDRVHSENQAKITAEAFIKLKHLHDEIDKSLNKSVPEKIEPVCFVNGEFYFVTTPIYLPGIKLVSVESPLGRKLLGKKVGDKIKFQLSSFQVFSIE